MIRMLDDAQYAWFAVPKCWHNNRVLQTASGPQDKKNPNTATELFSNKVVEEPFNEESGRFQEKTLKLLVPNSKRLRGYIQIGVLFSSKKVHTTWRSHEALHGFAQESTRTTLVPARQDLKEQDEASRTQPWSARGLVGAGPTGYPARKGEELA